MESMDTPLEELMLLVLLEPSGTGALNTGFTKEEEDEQGGEDCAGGWDKGSGRF